MKEQFYQVRDIVHAHM